MPWGVDFVATVQQQLKAAGFDHFGLTALEKPISMDFYRTWIEAGHHGSMDYLAEHLEMKADPKKLAPRALSAIAIAKPYYPHPYPSAQQNKASSLRTALYAQGDDYHFKFKNELEKIAGVLRVKYPDEEFLCFTDSGPILERDLAYRAGLGWVGKNTCLIHPEKGSLFFIGQILTSLPAQNAVEPIKDFCGSCDRCIRACPTGAIIEPRKLDATKCIAYWTIEAPGPAPEALKPKIGDWFFGCDICQTVCPWNEKAYGRDLLRSLSAEQPAPAVEDLRWVLSSSNKTLQKAFFRTPVYRARPRGLKRNALQIVGNLKMSELKGEVERHLDDPHLSAIARWALAQLP